MAQTRFYTVYGNLDQIKRDCVLVQMRWVTANPLQPNRVKHECKDAAVADALYNALKCRGLVAMKDWV